MRGDLFSESNELTDGSLLDSQKTDIKQEEGVAIDRVAGIALIIDDAGHKLHMIKIKI